MGKAAVKFIKGFIIGASMLVPGVSGGTMAIVLGVYDELIGAVSNIRKAFKRNVLLLVVYAAGGLIGIILLSGPLLRLVTWAPIPSLYFFMGAIIAGIPPLYRQARRPVRSQRPDLVFEGRVIERHSDGTRLHLVDVLVAIVGAAIGVGLEFLPQGLIPAPDEAGFVASVILFFAGVIIAVALILPGISGSYMLLVFGMYDVTLLAIREINISYLAPLVLGALIGTFATAKGIDNLMRAHPRFIFILIIGFMIGSLYEIFPGLPSGVEWAIAPVTFAAGFLIIFCLVSRRERNEG
jgi:putative membrane protein